MSKIAGLGINDSRYTVHLGGGNEPQWTCPDYAQWCSILYNIQSKGNGTCDDGLTRFSYFSKLLSSSNYKRTKHSIIDSCTNGVGNKLSDYLIVRKEHSSIFKFRTPKEGCPMWVGSYMKDGTTHYIARYRSHVTGKRTGKRGFKTKHEASFYAMEMYAAYLISIAETYDDKRTKNGIIIVAMRMITLAKNGIMFIPRKGK